MENTKNGMTVSCWGRRHSHQVGTGKALNVPYSNLHGGYTRAYYFLTVRMVYKNLLYV